MVELVSFSFSTNPECAHRAGKDSGRDIQGKVHQEVKENVRNISSCADLVTLLRVMCAGWLLGWFTQEVYWREFVVVPTH